MKRERGKARSGNFRRREKRKSEKTKKFMRNFATRFSKFQNVSILAPNF